MHIKLACKIGSSHLAPFKPAAFLAMLISAGHGQAIALDNRRQPECVIVLSTNTGIASVKLARDHT